MFDFLGNSFGGKRSSEIIVFVFEIRACLLFVNSGPGIDVKKKRKMKVVTWCILESCRIGGGPRHPLDPYTEVIIQSENQFWKITIGKAMGPSNQGVSFELASACRCAAMVYGAAVQRSVSPLYMLSHDMTRWGDQRFSSPTFLHWQFPENSPVPTRHVHQ